MYSEKKVTGVACPMIAPPGRVAATILRRGTCNPPLKERTHQADELSEDDTSGSLSEQISDHDTPGEIGDDEALSPRVPRDREEIRRRARYVWFS